VTPARAALSLLGAGTARLKGPGGCAVSLVGWLHRSRFSASQASRSRYVQLFVVPVSCIVAIR
jgi:hypothetical protein